MNKLNRLNFIFFFGRNVVLLYQQYNINELMIHIGFLFIFPALFHLHTMESFPSPKTMIPFYSWCSIYSIMIIIFFHFCLAHWLNINLSTNEFLTWLKVVIIYFERLFQVHCHLSISDFVYVHFFFPLLNWPLEQIEDLQSMTIDNQSTKIYL